MLIHLCLSATDARVTAREENNFILLSRDKFCLLVLARFWSEPYFSLSLAPVCSPTPTLASHLISESVCWLPPVSPGYETTWVAWLTFPFGFAVAAVFQLFHPVVPLLFSSLPRWALFRSASTQREQHHGDHFLCKNSSKLVYIERKKRAHLMFSPGVVVNKYLLHQCLDTTRPCPSTVKTRGRRQIWMTLWMTLAPVPWTVWIFRAFQRLASRLQIHVMTLITLDLMGSSLSGFSFSSEHFFQSAGGRPCRSPLHL